MYELELNIRRLEELFKTKISKKDYEKSSIIPTESFIDWIRYHNIDAKCVVILKVYHTQEIGIKYEELNFDSILDVEFTMFNIISKISLNFKSDSDRNLFKLTWS